MKTLVVYNQSGQLIFLQTNATEQYKCLVEDVNDGQEVIGVDIKTNKFILTDKITTASDNEKLKIQLNTKNNELSSVQLQLNSVSGELNSTKTELTKKETELTSTQKELTSTQAQFNSVKSQLTSTKTELLNTQASIVDSTYKALIKNTEKC